MRSRSAVVLFLMLGAVGAAAQGAVVLSVEGQARLTSAGAEGSRLVETGMEILPGDVLVTGPDGEVVLLNADGSRLDLLPNSSLTVTERKPAPGLLQRLWRAVTSKLADTEAVRADAGRVGALRAPVDDEVLCNDAASPQELAEMRGLLESVDALGYPETAADILRAAIFEQYGQFLEAEAIYLRRVDLDPRDPTPYDLLLDLYLKTELYGRAGEVLRLRRERAGSGT